MKKNARPMVMEPISEETRAKLRTIESRIDELKRQIKELEEDAYTLVPKHTFEECKAMGCEHTFRNRWDCHCHCVRRKGYTGCFNDYYRAQEKKVYIPEKYPMLNWKTVVGSCNDYVRKVIKETDRTLILEGGDQLLKSKVFVIEDVQYIKDRSDYTYMCADVPENVEMAKTLLKIRHSEWVENFRASIKLDDTIKASDKYAGVEKQPDETQEEYETRIFGDEGGTEI